MTALDAFRTKYGLTSGTSPIVATTAGRPELLALFAAMHFTRGAEIGVWEGKFSERMCQMIPGLHVTAVDPWRPYAAYREKKTDQERLDAAYRDTCQRLAPYRARMLRLTSLDAAAAVTDLSLDFVYIDGNHEKGHVLEDLSAWTPKIKPGGMLAGHDYRTHPAKPFIEVKDAVDAFTRAREIEPWFVLAAERTPSFFWVVA